jgi:hypothetical protein
MRKDDVIKAFSEQCDFHQLIKATVLAESSNYILFHHDLSVPAISTDMSQVGVALFPSF